MHLILTGATGLVGSAVLHHILSLPPTSAAAQQLSRLTILGRRAEIPLLSHPDRPTANTQTKIAVVPHADFNSYSTEVLSKLKDAGDGDGKVGVVWALGCSSQDVKEEKLYDEITRIYPLKAAEAFSTSLGAQQVNFVYVSGEGATTTPGMFTMMFGRVKGQTERELLELMSREPYSTALRVYSARPAAVDGGKQAAINDEAARRNYRQSVAFKATEKLLLPLLRAGLMKCFHSPTQELGRVLTELAMGNGEKLSGKGVEGEGRTISNAGIRER
ncbi:hypothetical protein FA10DRAFT_269223 [Acaromyces ingoldii]|uniref:NAD(P)-binding domain-containing protein n=1 Tax=Acaromyces ingoldii TaxID=215250 RepID=A0A316YJR1_9BASI|nr:hypothetical protein FA10DRAFT_269223 [Acaromyces ingoldii]PWN87965.1 hypothetical protein FA10DRAFT_269223 [Acaromyces ingoldii]